MGGVDRGMVWPAWLRWFGLMALAQWVNPVARPSIAVSQQVAREHSSGGGHGPSELSVKVHDLGELLNKLRAHMYKVSAGMPVRR